MTKTKRKRKSCKYGRKSNGYCKKSNVSMKISKLVREGYPQKQAVAIALSMKNKLGPRGGYKRKNRKRKITQNSKRKKRKSKTKRKKSKTKRKKRTRKNRKTSKRKKKNRRKRRKRFMMEGVENNRFDWAEEMDRQDIIDEQIKEREIQNIIRNNINTTT